jgi:putative phosphoribosyl transferase
MRYRDRIDAGNRLADAIEDEGLPDGSGECLVLGIPRGGVPVADVVARRLGCDLDVLIVRKIGVPGNPEFAVGAVAEDGTSIVDTRLVARLGINDAYLAAETGRQRREVERRAHDLRRHRTAVPVTGRTCIVVDDGVATGSTLEAALRLIGRAGAAALIAAVPVGPPGTVHRLERVADAVVCPVQPSDFFAVGAWYDDFAQVPEEDVIRILDRRASG